MLSLYYQHVISLYLNLSEVKLSDILIQYTFLVIVFKAFIYYNRYSKYMLQNQYVLLFIKTP